MQQQLNCYLCQMCVNHQSTTQYENLYAAVFRTTIWATTKEWPQSDHNGTSVLRTNEAVISDVNLALM